MVYYVNDNSITGDVYCSAVGNNSNNGLSPSNPKLSLSNLLSVYSTSLSSGDVIYIDAGIYSDVNLTLNFNGISIIGTGPAKTIFNNNFASSDANRLFNVTGSNILLQGFCVTGYNKGTSGASAIQINGATNLTINNLLFDENKQGGASSTVVITGGSTVEFNGGGSSCNSHLSVAGGGVNVEGNNNNVTFNDFIFANNKKALEGGSGLFVKGTDGSSVVVVNNSSFSDNVNTSSTSGAAIALTGAQLQVNNSCFTNNHSNYSGGPAYGGAITVGRGAILSLDNCSFENNTMSASSSGRGGAIAIYTRLISGGGTGNSSVNIENCSFVSNSCDNVGKHIYNREGSGTSTINIFNCFFSDSGDDIRNISGTINLQNSNSPSISGFTAINTLPNSGSTSTNCPILQGSCYGTILPVELSTFSGKCLDGMGALTWTTDSEHSNAYFMVERSQDDNDFTTISVINGAINSIEKSEYRFLDKEMQKGTNYYRLSQTDIDGQTRILETITIENNCFGNGLDATAFVVDEVNNQVLLLMNVELKVDFEFTLTDNMGRLLLYKDLTSDPHQNKVTIVLPDSMAAGVYHLTVTDGSIRVNNKVFMNK